MNKNQVIRTKMSAAFIRAVQDCGKQGRNAGHVGRVVVTNAAKGVGIKYAPRSKARLLQAGYTAYEILLHMLLVAIIAGFSLVLYVQFINA